MEDVVLHYRPASAAGLSSLLDSTEKLLEPFPCRTPPVFTPWFPTSVADRLPIRPAKLAPVITSSAGLFFSNCHRAAAEISELLGAKDHVPVSDRHPDCSASETVGAPERTPTNKDDICVAKTPNHLLLFSPCNQPESRTPRLSPEEQPQKDCPIGRSWCVFTHRGVLRQSFQSLSKQFHHTVSAHSLHLRQRAKWVISEENCGGGGGIEQVWLALRRSVRSAGLPTCNANIQRERAEVWVFCDVLYAEQVGRFLKDELQLTGRIGLSVPRLGNIFSL